MALMYIPAVIGPNPLTTGMYGSAVIGRMTAGAIIGNPVIGEGLNVRVGQAPAGKHIVFKE
jgi:hypothetical protein